MGVHTVHVDEAVSGDEEEFRLESNILTIKDFDSGAHEDLRTPTQAEEDRQCCLWAALGRKYVNEWGSCWRADILDVKNSG
jgi:hypothetical protein